jgi:hypothetical protein
MYVYTMQPMPGSKAQFDGDTSIRYRVRRKHTSASANHKSSTDVIRTDLSYSEATELVKRFNDKERESRALKSQAEASLTQNA